MRTNYPSPEQLYAIEAAARRARSAELARLLKAGAEALKTGISRAAAVLNTKGVRHA